VLTVYNRTVSKTQSRLVLCKLQLTAFFSCLLFIPVLYMCILWVNTRYLHCIVLYCIVLFIIEQ